MLDYEVIEKFKEFQQKTGKYRDLVIEDVQFEKVDLFNKNQKYKSVFDIVRRGASPRPIKNFIVSNDSTEEKYNWLKIGDVTKSNIYLKSTSQFINKKGKEKSVLGKKGDFLLTNSMTVGIPIILDIDTCFHDGFLYLGFKDRKQQNYYNLYLYYYFKSYRDKLILKSKDGIVKNLNTDIMKDEKIPIPKKLNNYTSYEIQKIIVNFLETWKMEYTDKCMLKVEKLKPVYNKLKKIIITNTLKYDKVLEEYFYIFAKKQGYSLNLKDIHFEKKLLKDLVSHPIKGGGTPDTKIYRYWSNEFKLVDNKKYFGWRNIEKKLFEKKYISEYSKVITYEALKSSSTWLIPSNSILIAIASASKGLIVINEKPMCTNQNILGVTIDDKHYTDYIYYHLKNIYLTIDGKKDFGNLTKGSEEDREIHIPANTKDYDSIEIQKILVKFWETIFVNIDKKLYDLNKISNLAEKLDSAFLCRTFNKIDWNKDG